MRNLLFVELSYGINPLPLLKKQSDIDDSVIMNTIGLKEGRFRNLLS